MRFSVNIIVVAFFLFQSIVSLKAQEKGQLKGFTNENSNRFSAIKYIEKEILTNSKPDVTLGIDYSKKVNPVSNHIFGINSTTYTGNYLADTSLLSYLNHLKPGVIRFPGGDASNMYFWNGLPDDLPDQALTFDGAWTDFTDGTVPVYNG